MKILSAHQLQFIPWLGYFSKIKTSKKYVILGLRGGLYDPNDLTWAIEQGVTIISTDKFYQIGIKESLKIINDIRYSSVSLLPGIMQSDMAYCDVLDWFT